MSAADLCASLRGSLPELFECTPAPRGAVRVRTPFMYPDGGIVDAFVLDRDGRYIITDHGEAMGWLRMQSIRGRLSAKQRRLVDDVCLTLSVELHKGQLVLRCTEPDHLGEVVHRLGQAIVRVSDLWFTFRTRAMETVADEVGDWLEEKCISFKRSTKHNGRSGRVWTVDYETFAPERTSIIFLLGTASRAAARRMTEHVLAGCIDLSHLKSSQPHFAFVSLFDDSSDVWREEDFRLVESRSEIATWSRPDEFGRILTAA